MKYKKHWYDYLWIAELVYFSLGFFNILFAWLGLCMFLIPLILALAGWDKAYCNRYCGRGQLFALLGGKAGLSHWRNVPAWLRSKTSRYGFLFFFMVMFTNMLHTTWLVYSGATNLKQVVTLLWTFKLPWYWAYSGNAAPWAAQFAFGFYSIMMTSTVLGIISLLLWKPRSWCVYCPMGTMTQTICRIKHNEKE